MDATILKRLRNDLDIVEVVGEYVPLSKKGRSFVGLCPFHDDKNPSMYVSPAKQLFNCFSCGAKGDVITFVARFEKIPIAKAIAKLASRLGITYDETAYAPRYPAAADVLLQALSDATAYYEYARELAPPSFAAYLAKRHLNLALCERFRIGYAPPRDKIKDFLVSKGHDEATLINAALINDQSQPFFQNRLMFPLINEHGDVVGFSGRTLDDNSAKYINSSESLIFRKKSLLYNYASARDAITQAQSVIVCEGQMDVIALVASGMENVVAVMGTALTTEHLNLLENKPRVVLNFDGDAAGRTATAKSLALLYRSGFQATVVVAQTTKDVDELWRTAGPAAVQAAVATQVDALIWSYDLARATLGANVTPKAIEELITQLAPFWIASSLVSQSVLLEKISSDLKVPVAGLNAAFASAASKLRSYAPPMWLEEEVMLPSDAPAATRLRDPFRYTHKMLKSMLHSPALITFYAQQAAHVHIAESQLQELAAYLVASQLAPQPPLSSAAQKLMEELKNNPTPVETTSDEFAELLSRVNVEFYNYYIKIYNERMGAAKTQEEISEITRAIIEFKIKKEKIHNEE